MKRLEDIGLDTIIDKIITDLDTFPLGLKEEAFKLLFEKLSLRVDLDTLTNMVKYTIVKVDSIIEKIVDDFDGEFDESIARITFEEQSITIELYVDFIKGIIMTIYLLDEEPLYYILPFSILNDLILKMEDVKDNVLTGSDFLNFIHSKRLE